VELCQFPCIPSGCEYPTDLDSHGWGYAITSATSNHTGGVNAALGDGSVRFVSDSVGSGDPNADVNGTVYPTAGSPKEFTGRSPFGVWGALGTINGGESTSL